jgi:hypothetical protein
LKKRKLIYRFHNPNSVEDTAEFLCKILIEANMAKVERAIQQAALSCADETNDIVEPPKGQQHELHST